MVWSLRFRDGVDGFSFVEMHLGFGERTSPTPPKEGLSNAQTLAYLIIHFVFQASFCLP